MMYVEKCMIVCVCVFNSYKFQSYKREQQASHADCVELHRSLNKSLLMNAHISILLLVLTLFYFAFYHLFIVTALW